MNILEKMNDLIKDCMKVGNLDILSIARLVKSDLLANTKSEHPRSEVDVIKTMKKKLLEEIDAFKSNEDKVKTLKYQLEWVEQFLPKPLTVDELSEWWGSLDKLPSTEMKSIMPFIKSAFGDRFDGKVVTEFIKTLN